LIKNIANGIHEELEEIEGDVKSKLVNNRTEIQTAE